jgi:hypothetical protein
MSETLEQKVARLNRYNRYNRHDGARNTRFFERLWTPLQAEIKQAGLELVYKEKAKRYILQEREASSLDFLNFKGW